MRRLLTGMLVGLGLALGTAACGSGDNAYVKDNKVLLESLPVPSQAERVRVSSHPYYKYETDIVEGYSTSADYRVPPDMTDDQVIEFYVGALGNGWEHCREDVPIAEPVPAGQTPGPILGELRLAHFKRGPEIVSVSAAGLHPMSFTGTYGVSVDHDAREDPCTGEELR